MSFVHYDAALRCRLISAFFAWIAARNEMEKRDVSEFNVTLEIQRPSVRLNVLDASGRWESFYAVALTDEMAQALDAGDQARLNDLVAAAMDVAVAEHEAELANDPQMKAFVENPEAALRAATAEMHEDASGKRETAAERAKKKWSLS